MVCSVYKLKKRGEGGDQQSAGITEYMIKPAFGQLAAHASNEQGQV